MFEMEVPFDHTTKTVRLEDKNFAGTLIGHQNEFKTDKTQEQLVEDALDHPFGSPTRE